MKVQNLIKLAGFYRNATRNRDRVKSKLNWWKTKWGRRDDWNMR